MDVIWTLLLTVCMDSRCLTQDIQWFDERSDCIEMKDVHEEIQPDGHWKTVEYTCTVKNAILI